MAKLKRLLWLSAVATVTFSAYLIIANPPAQANCNDFVGRVEFWQFPMQRYCQQLLQQIHYPWDQSCPYGHCSTVG